LRRVRAFHLIINIHPHYNRFYVKILTPYNSEPIIYHMKKFFIILAILCSLAGAFVLTSCGERVEVPTAHVGKIKTASGLQDGLKYPSAFRLPYSFFVRNELVLVETSHFPVKESIKLFMPKDKLNLTFEVRGTMFISPEKSEQIFDKMTEQLIRSKVRSIVSRYSIPELMEQRETINTELVKEIKELFSGKEYPIGVIQFGLADIQYPEVIVKAQELAKEREVAIETAEAQKQVQLKEAEAALETFVLPMEAFSRPDMLMGVYNKAFSEDGQ